MKKIKKFKKYNDLKDFLTSVDCSIPINIDKQWSSIEEDVKFELIIYSNYKSGGSMSVTVNGNVFSVEYLLREAYLDFNPNIKRKLINLGFAE